MSSTARELNAGELWNTCDPASFDFESTATLPAELIIIGQDRAIEALDFGIDIASYGYNIFVLGENRTGRTTTVRTFLDRAAAARPVPSDWIYVNNFADPNRPCAIPLPPGTALQLQRDMQALVRDLQVEIPRAFESEAYERQRDRFVRALQEQQNALVAELEQAVGQYGFALVKTPTGLGMAPVVGGQVITPEAYEQLDETARQTIAGQEEPAGALVADAMRRVRELEKQIKKQLQEMDRQVASTVVERLMEDLRRDYGHLAEVPDYLDQVRADIVDRVDGFKSQEEAAPDPERPPAGDRLQALLRRYAINVIVDHAHRQGAPVIVEPHPTYANLLGRIEHRAEFGALVTDFSLIRAGALHRANGGYLVIEARSLLNSALAWEGLKRALKNTEIRIEQPGDDGQGASTISPEPEPIPLQIKVVLLGGPDSYYLLYDLDEDFRKLFKVKAEFGADFARTGDTTGCYANFVAVRCREEGLLHFSSEAVARVVEYGSRLAQHQLKLSTHFGEIADLVREASFWARREQRDRVLAADLDKALAEKTRRSNRAEEEIQELLGDGTIRVDVTGRAVGQVNGLSVLSLGDYEFGRPSRITVRTYTGKSGVISLDREARLSGRFYDKGVLTLSGYLGGKYALDAPLSLSATISFEQLYDEVDGDSASSGELYALLSSLSDLPLSQAIAVTGSVDQQGNLQPVGGVNEKIEGFFETCQRRGLTGEQGVIVPAQNTINLMLNAQVRQAVADARFHIYAVRTVDEGLALLTGIEAGELQPDGTYPPESVHGRVMARLAEIAENLREAKDDEDELEDDPYDSELSGSGLEARPRQRRRIRRPAAVGRSARKS